MLRDCRRGEEIFTLSLLGLGLLFLVVVVIFIEIDLAFGCLCCRRRKSLTRSLLLSLMLLLRLLLMLLMLLMLWLGGLSAVPLVSLPHRLLSVISQATFVCIATVDLVSRSGDVLVVILSRAGATGAVGGVIRLLVAPRRLLW